MKILHLFIFTILLTFLLIPTLAIALDSVANVGGIGGFISGLLAGNLGEWVSAITGLLTAATAITALTPTTVDNKILNAILKVLNIFAGNVLKNKNQDA